MLKYNLNMCMGTGVKIPDKMYSIVKMIKIKLFIMQLQL